MAREEQNTQQPTGGKGPGFHRKKQSISKGELPKQKGARGIIVEEKLKTMDEVGQSVASKNLKRPCSGLSEEEREKWQNEDCQRRRKKKKMPIDDDFIQLDDLIDDDFIQLDDLTSFNSLLFGSSFDGQSPTIGREEAVMNKAPDQYKFGSSFDGQASVLGRKEAAMNEPPVQYKEIGSLGSKSHTIFNA